MKQKLLIILALVFVLVLLAVFIYLYVFGAPKTEDNQPIWNALGLAGEEEVGVTIPVPNPEGMAGEGGNQAKPQLRQLTTKPIIGFIEYQATTTDPITILYAESGTGHIYQLDRNSGIENRISNTTIAEASYVSFSPRASQVAFRSGEKRQPNNVRTFDLSIASGLSEQTIVSDLVEDFKILNEKELIYTSRSDKGLVNYAYNLETGIDTPLFTVPFFEAQMRWGTTSQATHFAYPKPSTLLEGYLYAFNRGKMSRLPIQGFGLTVFPVNNFLLYSLDKDREPLGRIYNLTQNTTEDTAILMLPEKCTTSRKTPTLAWCGHELGGDMTNFPDNWYKGLTSYQDNIWEISLPTLETTSLISILSESGRAVDITEMSIGQSETALYFINKNDNTLWMYEL